MKRKIETSKILLERFDNHAAIGILTVEDASKTLRQILENTIAIMEELDNEDS